MTEFFFFNLYVDVLHWASLFFFFFPLPTLDAHPEWSVTTAQAGLGLVDSMKQDKNRLSGVAGCRLAESKLTI